MLKKTTKLYDNVFNELQKINALLTYPGKLTPRQTIELEIRKEILEDKLQTVAEQLVQLIKLRNKSGKEEPQRI